MSFFIFNYIEFNLDFFEISIDIDFIAANTNAKTAITIIVIKNVIYYYTPPYFIKIGIA